MTNLPESFYRNNEWSYQEDSFGFNGVNYKAEYIKASDIVIGDIIVVSNGGEVTGIGEVINIERTSILDKYRNSIPLKYFYTEINSKECTSYSFGEEFDRIMTKVNLA